MSARRGIGAAILFASTLALAGRAARAADDVGEIDDPKVARRLGARIDWAGRVVLRPSPEPGAPVAPVTPLAPPPPADAGGPEATIASAAAPAPRAGQPNAFVAPRFKLALRHFSFFRLGASSSPDGRADDEAFDSLAIDVYPISSLIRVGLSTQFGWQSASGTLSTSGDYFAAESLSVGAQWLGNRVVPFAEAFGGVGYMRRLQFDRSMPTAYFQFGVDVGAEIYFGRVGFVSLALGYLRPINGFAVQQTFVTAFVDSWSLKLGIGL
jgi:hypothetical protein